MSVLRRSLAYKLAHGSHLRPNTIRSQSLVMRSMDEERQRLERVFTENLEHSTRIDAYETIDETAPMTGHYSKLPVWTMQTEILDLDDVPTYVDGMPLPGLQTTFSIREPSKVKAFADVVLGFGSPVFAAVSRQGIPGSVGTLMEVASWQRLPDQLLVHALGVGRIRLDKCYDTEELHAFADCMLQPDEEEIQYHLPTGTGQVMAKIRKLEALSQDVLATLEDGYFQVHRPSISPAPPPTLSASTPTAVPLGSLNYLSGFRV